MVKRVLIVDDHCILREGLRALLAEDENLSIVADVASGQEAVDRVRHGDVDVVLMDITMPEMDGVAATRQIRAMDPRVKVVAMTASGERRHVMQMLEAGASGYVLKETQCDELRRAIHSVVEGQSYLSPAVASAVVQGFIGRSAPSREGNGELASRERQVLQLLADGRTSLEIAGELGIAPSTVETHRRNIMKKLDLHSVAQLTKYAIRQGLTSV